ncbi:MAG: DUF695 domain-containing protein [Ginsengibacter sp.]|jgi:uncharacterized protein (TIGR01619 family)
MKGIQTITIFFIGLTIILLSPCSKTIGQSLSNFKSTFLQIKTDDHIAEWDFYFSNVDDKPSALFVDLGLHTVAPIEDKSNFIWISIKMNHAQQDGLSSSGENKLLGEMEDKLVRKIQSKYNSVYVGRLTSNGSRDLYFYVEDTPLYEKVIEEVMNAYPQYKFDFGTKKDEDWRGYFNFIYPSPQQFQSLQNRRVIDQLQKKGDKLTKLRDVDHWINFKSKKDRDLFLYKIKFEGFTVISWTLDNKSAELPYKLHIKRFDKVDWSSVDTYVIHLWKVAKECQGDYDSWETSVVKN